MPERFLRSFRGARAGRARTARERVLHDAAGDLQRAGGQSPAGDRHVSRVQIHPEPDQARMPKTQRTDAQ